MTVHHPSFPALVAALLLAFLPVLSRAQPYPETKWTPSDPRIDQDFGAAVALDGAVALVGAFRDDAATGAGEQGAAYVFRFDGGAWAEEQKLVAPQRDNLDWFGWSVAVSGDVALVGTRNDEDVPLAAGAVYVFRYDGSTWVEEAKLVASDGAAGDHFGRALAVEGDVALVGSALQDVGGLDRGAVYVFRYEAGAWVEAQKLVASDAQDFASFGEAVALSGTRALVGAWNATSPPGLNNGAAYVFEEDGGLWTQTARLAPPTTGLTQFGIAADLDGDWAIVGAPLFGSGAGAAYLFRYDGSAWTEAQRVEAPDPNGFDLFGDAVALEGARALVGAANWSLPNADATGKAYLFAYDAVTGLWQEEVGLVGSDGAGGDAFGSVVALDGGVPLVGAPNHDLPLANTGAVYVYGAPVATAAEAGLPAGSFAFSPAGPTPFRERTAFALTLEAAQPVTVAVYDVLGRRVAVLHDGPLAAGAHRLVWEAGAAAAGVYVVRAVGEAATMAHRVVHLR